MKTHLKLPMKIFILTILFIVAAIVVNESVRAESVPNVTFPETGYSIDGAFNDYFFSSNDPLTTFGYPITNACLDNQTNLRIQYFQRARFELVETPTGSHIQQTKLGQFFYATDRGTEVEIPNGNSICRTFEETGKKVCYSFLSFYEAHNGEQFMGLPISNAEIHENGRYIQYFEYTRLEWRPEAPDGQHIILSDLGKIYYDEYGSSSFNCTENDIAAQKTIKIQAHAFTNIALLPAGGKQTVYISVLNQNFQPVKGAKLDATVVYPGKEPENFRIPDTNEYGISTLEFSIDDYPVQTVVEIQVNASYHEIYTTANSWFRVWY